MTDKVSQFRLYTVGTVAANKPLDSHEIEFTPDEENIFVEGELTDNATTVTAKGLNASGQAYEQSLTATNTQRAKWRPMGDTNRKTSPDVRRGDRVRIWMFADADSFYWDKLFDDPKITKLETVIHAFSNVRKEDEVVTADKSYFFEVSTHKKYIHIHTSKNDGEPFAYDIQINTEKGFIQMTDDVGNVFELDSANTKLTLRNIDDTYIELDKRVLNMHALDEVNITGGKRVNITAGQQLNEKSPTINTQANTTNNDVDQTTNSGTQTTVGLTTTGGLASIATGGSDGGFSTQGSGTINGSVTVTDTVNGNRGVFPGGVTAPNV